MDKDRSKQGVSNLDKSKYKGSEQERSNDAQRDRRSSDVAIGRLETDVAIIRDDLHELVLSTQAIVNFWNEAEHSLRMLSRIGALAKIVAAIGAACATLWAAIHFGDKIK